jgi:hypothetical protein
MPDDEQPSRADQKAAKRAARDAELAECLAAISATLDQYDAALDVVVTTVYRNGQAVHSTQVQVISK